LDDVQKKMAEEGILQTARKRGIDPKKLNFEVSAREKFTDDDAEGRQVMAIPHLAL
jgi:hypothetical protein